jgi:hypothetical protein
VARGQAQVRENADDHRGLFDGGDDLEAPVTIRAVLHVDVGYTLLPSDRRWSILLKNS